MHFCIFDMLYSAIMHIKSLRFDHLNNHKSMGPYRWTFQMNIKHRQSRHNSIGFVLFRLNPGLAKQGVQIRR